MNKNNILVAIVVFSALTTYATTPCQSGGRDGNGCSPIPKTADSGSGVQDQSKNAANSNAGGSMLGQLGTIVGIGYAAMNASQCFSPANECTQFALGIAGAAAGMLLSSDHGAAGAGAVDSGNAATVGGSGSADDFNSKLPTYSEMQKSIEGLKAKGVIVDPKKNTITFPNGSKLTASDATNAGKLGAALGTSLDQDSLNSGMRGILAKAQDKAAGYKDFAGTDMNSLDGGGGGGSHGGGEGYASEPAAAGAVKTVTLPERAPTAAITLKKQFGDSFIGDASENIFGMVNNRYKLKDSENSFITAVPSVNK